MQLFVLFLIVLYLISFLKKKDYYPLDKGVTSSLKGICCVLIVWVHICGVTFFPLTSFAHWGAPIVSLFFFFSGYGLMSSFLSKGDTYLDHFLRKRVFKVINPLLWASILFVIVNYWDTNSLPYDWAEQLFIKGNPPLPYSWFGYAIVIFYLFFYFVFRIRSFTVETKIITVAILTVICIFVMIQIGYDRCWWVSNLAFPAGLLYRYKENILIPFFREKWVKLLFVPLSCISLFLLVKSGIDYLFTLAYIVIPILVVVLISYWKMPQNRTLKFLGDISYEVYLLQGIAIYMLRGQHVHIDSAILYIIGVYVLTILLAFILHKVLSLKLKK